MSTCRIVFSPRGWKDGVHACSPSDVFLFLLRTRSWMSFVGFARFKRGSSEAVMSRWTWNPFALKSCGCYCGPGVETPRRLTCWNDDPLLLGGAARWCGGLGADAGLRVRGLVRHGGPVAAHVSGAFGDAAVHRRLPAETQSSGFSAWIHHVCVSCLQQPNLQILQRKFVSCRSVLSAGHRS